MNLLDYLINTIKGFHEKNPRIIIHIKHPEKDDVLIHYAHSSGHSHRVKEYEPPIEGSTAGYAWRTNEIYYVSDVEDPQYEYDRKEHSSKYYRTILCVPLKAGADKSTRIGVLSITRKPVDAYEKIEHVMLFASLLYPLIYMDIKIGRFPPMGDFERVPEEVRKELNKLYWEGAITHKQLMQRMKNDLFDHEWLAVKEKFKKLIEKYNFK